MDNAYMIFQFSLTGQLKIVLLSLTAVSPENLSSSLMILDDTAQVPIQISVHFIHIRLKIRWATEVRILLLCCPVIHFFICFSLSCSGSLFSCLPFFRYVKNFILLSSDINFKNQFPLVGSWSREIKYANSFFFPNIVNKNVVAWLQVI